MLLRWDCSPPLGEHVHLALWAGEDEDHLALCGRLTMRLAEWRFLKRMLNDASGSFEVRPLPGGESVVLT
jgi:hypothetical protein